MRWIMRVFEMQQSLVPRRRWTWQLILLLWGQTELVIWHIALVLAGQHRKFLACHVRHPSCI